MTRLKLSDVTGEAPVKLTIEIPARLHRRLSDYAIILNDGNEKGAPPPSALVGPILERFLAADRDFIRQRRRINGTRLRPD